MSEPDPCTLLAGRRVLVVEDEALVAMMIEDALLDLGCVVLGPVATTREALALISEMGIDAATLDINLTYEEVFPVAEALESKGIRFILLTGYDRANVLERYNRWPLVQKPFTEDKLVSGLAKVLAA